MRSSVMQRAPLAEATAPVGATGASGVSGSIDPAVPAHGRPLKILYHHRTASRDGQAVHIDELIAALRRQGHEVTIVAPPFPAEGGFGGDSSLVRSLKDRLPGALYQIMEIAYSIVAYRALRRACRRERPDVLYERYNLHLLAGVWLRRRLGIPYFVEVNAPLAEERARFDGLALPGLARWCERTTWRGADMVLPVTRVLAGAVRAAGVPASHVTVIPNGIDPARFQRPLDAAETRAALGLGEAVVLGFTGFVREWHGLDKVVELLDDPSLPPLHLLVVGDGPGRAALEEQAARRGVAHALTITGVVARDRIPQIVSAFDVALQPSATAYASPLKLFEYMALGRAILAPRQPNIEEVLTDGRSALLVDPSDPGSLRAALVHLCRDAELRRRLGDGARSAIGELGLTWDENARRLSRLFEAAIAR